MEYKNVNNTNRHRRACPGFIGRFNKKMNIYLFNDDINTPSVIDGHWPEGHLG